MSKYTTYLLISSNIEHTLFSMGFEGRRINLASFSQPSCYSLHSNVGLYFSWEKVALFLLKLGKTTHTKKTVLQALPSNNTPCSSQQTFKSLRRCNTRLNIISTHCFYDHLAVTIPLPKELDIEELTTQKLFNYWSNHKALTKLINKLPCNWPDCWYSLWAPNFLSQFFREKVRTTYTR